MAPGLPAAWPSRCAVCLMAVAGAALGPLGGPAHGSPVPDRPSVTGPSVSAAPISATGPADTSSTAPPVPDPAGSPPPLPPGSASPSAPSSVLPLPSGAPVAGASRTDAGTSDEASFPDGGEAPAGPAADSPESPSPSPSASPDVSGSTAPLAGREAGAGKARPGRSLTPLEQAQAETPVEADEPEESVVDTVDLPVSTPPPDAFTNPAQRAGQALDAESVRRVQQVSLGAGIALVGLGLGFLAFRMRRID